jgi:PAS domain S-box-containing protein
VVIDPIRAAAARADRLRQDHARHHRAQAPRRTRCAASEEQFRLLVQGVTDYAIYMLSPTGEVTNWNAGAQRIKGYKQRTRSVGSHFSRFYTEEDRDSRPARRALIDAATEGRFEGEGWRVRKDGTASGPTWSSIRSRQRHGRAARLRQGHARHHRTRDAAAGAGARARPLFQSQKLEAIGKLTGGVAHDFNNLLMVVLTSLELLRRRMPDDKKLHALVDTATQGAKRGVTLTQRMLAFARRQELRPESVDLEALAGGMRELLERTLGPTIAIETAFEAGLGPVLVDPHQLELAILNLAVNARDAMPQGGVLRLEAREEVHAATAGPESLKPGTYVRLSIADTGSGMNAQTLARAVEPFFTTKGVGKGTGLGLAMVQGLAGQSGGRFGLSSTEGVGTRAELWLPMAGTPAARNAAVPGAGAGAGAGAGPAMAPPPAARGLKVLAVDDDPLVLAGTASMLEDLGHAVLAASSAEEALGLLDESVHLVISDQVMPKMTGAQLFRELQHKHPALPFVLASGYADLDEDVSAMAVNLPKPFNQAQLSAAIAAAMDR